MSWLIRSRKVHSRWLLVFTALEVQLCAFHVQLSGWIVRCSMQSDQLSPQQRLSSLDAIGDLEGECAPNLNEAAHFPYALSIHTVLEELEPCEAVGIHPARMLGEL